MEVEHSKDLPLFSRTLSEAPVPKRWTVTELTSQIRGVLEPAFTQVWIQGEVSNYRPAPSGHAYFSLKDQAACISAALFGWGARKKAFELKDGLLVLCRGKVTVYPPRGSYQLIIDQIEPLGAGALQVTFDQLKAKLAAEGLFDSTLKRPLPRFPTQVAVITSPSGAAIQDMLTILKRRAPHLKVVVVPALVQGESASAQIIRALEAVNRHRLGEVIVLARGGGSIEDLWCFNHEALARKIRASELPVISAVGHEIDFTISDFVADLRAPTPSAAAEILTGNWVEARQRLNETSARVRAVILRDLSHRKNLLAYLAARVVSPKDRLREQAQRTDDLILRMERAIRRNLEKKQAGLDHWTGKLDALSPLRVLERGYTLVKDPQIGIVKSANQVRPGQDLDITFYDGQRTVRVV